MASSIEQNVFDQDGHSKHYLRDLDDEPDGLLLHGIPSFPSEGNFVFGFSLLETPAVGLDELQAVGDELVGAFGDSLIGLPDVPVEGPDDSDSGSLVKAPGCDVCEFLEADDTDPAGLLLGAVKCNVEGRHGIALGAVKHLGVRTKIPCQYALVEHDDSSPFHTNFGAIQEYP